jgi:hypothetical protein
MVWSGEAGRKKMGPAHCDVLLVKHHVSVGVLLREGVATWWLAKESGRMPACREGKADLLSVSSVSCQSKSGPNLAV